MPFASRGGFLAQPAAVSGGRREGAASTNTGMTWGANSGSTTSTTYAKYGSSSYYTSTNSTEIYTPNNPSFMNYGTGDFCIEWYMYIPTLAGHSASCDLTSQNVTQGFGYRLGRRYNNSGLGSGASAKYINIFARGYADLEYWDISTGSSGDATWQTGKWYFCVMQRKNANMSFFLDGVLKPVAGINHASFTGDTFNFASSTAGTNVNWGTADGGNGAGPIYTDEVCFSNTWRYDDTGDITTLPSAAFTVDEYTDMLLHMEGSNGGTSFTNDQG